MSSAPLIAARQLTTGYAHKVVGRDISLQVRAGQILCLLGPNGSGKSTLFRTLLGLQAALDGQVTIQQRVLAQWKPAQLAACIAWVPQAQDTPLPLTALQTVVLGRAARIPFFSVPSKADEARALDCLNALGIAHLAQRRYTQLSGGEKQLVLIARALAQEPQALIMDEPTASLDFGNQIRVLRHMRRLADGGMAILFCTHQPEHARRVADTVVLLKDGCLHGAEPPAAALTPARLAWLYDLEQSDLNDMNLADSGGA